MMEFPSLFLVILVTLLASIVQANIGMGYTLLGAPILALVNPALVPIPMLISSISLSLLVGLRERESVAPRELGWAFLGYLPGSLIAMYLVASTDSSGLSLILAGSVLVTVFASLLQPQITINSGSLLLAGTLSGFMGTSSSIAGPPMALLYQNRKNASIRATLALFFTGASLLSVLILTLGGQLTQQSILYTLLLLPATIVGFFLSSRTIKYFDKYSLRPAVLMLSAAAALLLIWRTLG